MSGETWRKVWESVNGDLIYSHVGFELGPYAFVSQDTDYKEHDVCICLPTKFFQ